MTAPRPVLFGKLPSHGDFLARGLQPAAREALDGWASHGLTHARHALGDGFEAAHDTAPPWRFVDGPGQFGPDWRAGAVAPSIDAAGRRFLILLAADGLDAQEAAERGEALAEAMEDLIYLAFEQVLDADGALAAVEAILERHKPHRQGQAAPEERWWTLGGPEHAPKAVEGRPPDDLMLEMLRPDAAGALT